MGGVGSITSIGRLAFRICVVLAGISCLYAIYSSSMPYLFGGPVKRFRFVRPWDSNVSYVLALKNETHVSSVSMGYHDKLLTAARANHPTSSTASSKWPIQLLIVVISARSNFANRAGIRKTWGKQTLLKKSLGNDIQGPFFFIGKTADDKNDVKIADENSTFGDIVKVPIADEFNLLTPKMFEVFAWANKRLANEKTGNNYFVLKTDDDVYVNVIEIVKSLYQSLNASGKCFYCQILKEAAVIRDQSSKLYVSQEIYKPDGYPNYCSGISYLFQAHLLDDIVKKAKEIKMLPNEDTYYTGLIAEALGIGHEPIGRVNFWSNAGLWAPETLCEVASVNVHHVVHRVTAGEMQKIQSCIVPP